MAAYQNGYMRTPYRGRSYSSSMQNCPCQRENMYSRETSCSHENSCREDTLSQFPVGMGYVPWQTWQDIYELDKSFHAGTIFQELDKPFLGRRAFKC